MVEQISIQKTKEANDCIIKKAEDWYVLPGYLYWDFLFDMSGLFYS